MNLKRTIYRANQFWADLRAAPDSVDLEQARMILNIDEYHLFMQLQPAERAHAMEVLHKLQARGAKDPELLEAALLHDIGKSLHPVRRWERVLVVLAKAILPAHVQQWGAGDPVGWRKPFVVAEQHPAWGAGMASRAGATPLAVNLIRRHQEALVQNPHSVEDHLLQCLQLAGDAS